MKNNKIGDCFSFALDLYVRLWRYYYVYFVLSLCTCFFPETMMVRAPAVRVFFDFSAQDWFISLCPFLKTKYPFSEIKEHTHHHFFCHTLSVSVFCCCVRVWYWYCSMWSVHNRDTVCVSVLYIPVSSGTVFGKGGGGGAGFATSTPTWHPHPFWHFQQQQLLPK